MRVTFGILDKDRQLDLQSKELCCFMHLISFYRKNWLNSSVLVLEIFSHFITMINKYLYNIDCLELWLALFWRTFGSTEIKPVTEFSIFLSWLKYSLDIGSPQFTTAIGNFCY